MNMAYILLGWFALLIALCLVFMFLVIYKYYRNCGMTRKQAFLCARRMYDQL